MTPDSQRREAWAAKPRIPRRLTLDDLIEMQRPHRERMADDLDRIHRARWGDWRDP